MLENSDSATKSNKHKLRATKAVIHENEDQVASRSSAPVKSQNADQTKDA